MILYGLDNKWTIGYAQPDGSTPCSNNYFGDPFVTADKVCMCVPILDMLSEVICAKFGAAESGLCTKINEQTEILIEDITTGNKDINDALDDIKDDTECILEEICPIENNLHILYDKACEIEEDMDCVKGISKKNYKGVSKLIKRNKN